MTTLKKLWNIVSTTLVVLMVLCAVFLMGSRLFGYECYTVISGSMQPEYMVGDLIYVKEVDVNTIEVGDDITFILNEDLVVATHRVIRIDAENQHFYTKGIANEIADTDPVHFNNVIGVPQFSIPKLGYVSDFVQHPPGLYITISVGAILILLVFLPDLLGKKKKEDTVEGEEKVAENNETNEENEKLKAEIESLKAQMAEKQGETPLGEKGADVTAPATEEQDTAD